MQLHVLILKCCVFITAKFKWELLQLIYFPIYLHSIGTIFTNISGNESHLRNHQSIVKMLVPAAYCSLRNLYFMLFCGPQLGSHQCRCCFRRKKKNKSKSNICFESCSQNVSNLFVIYVLLHNLKW